LDKRKELKLAYKQTPPPIGVYQIKNNMNNKIFVGSSMNLHGKSNSYTLQLKTNTHSNKTLQADWNLYGSAAFTFEILETLKTTEVSEDSWRKSVLAMEEKWINNLQPYDKQGYNKQKGLKANKV
jgi:group I intron endonuclease